MKVGLVLLAALTMPASASAAPPSPLVIRVVSGQSPAPSPGAPRPDRAVPTLADALAIAAGSRAREPWRPVVVQLPGGVMHLPVPVVIGPEAGGTRAAPLVIRGAPDGSTVLTGSVALQSLDTPIPPALVARLPAEARTHVRMYALPPRALAEPQPLATSLLRDRPTGPPLEIYDRRGALVPARWPNAGWGAVAAEPRPSGGTGFAVVGRAPDRWTDEPDLWAEGFWRFDWLWEAVPLRREPPPGLLGFATLPDEGVIKPGARVRIVHALSELDQPGEWWRDRADGLLLAWPRDEHPLELAATDVLLDLEKAAHIAIERVTFEHAREHAVLVHDSDDIRIARSTIRWIGGTGLVFDHATRSGLEDCTVEDTGGAGAVLQGGDRAALIASGLFARHNLFARFGRLVLTQQPGIDIDGVGVTVEGNLIRDAGAPGIGIHGNEHRVIANELTGLLAGITDNGMIYAGRDWTARGTVIAGNFLHDARSDPGFENKGVYLDDEASGFAIRGNIFLRVEQPVFIGGGRDNSVEGNLFVASSPAMHVDSRGQTWAAKAITDPSSDLRQAYAAVPVTSPVWRSRYPGLARMLADEPATAKGNRLTGNTVAVSTPFDFSDKAEATRQTIAGNRGPEGLGLPGSDLATLATSGRDPRAFAALIDAQGRPAGVVLDRGFAPGPAHANGP